MRSTRPTTFAGGNIPRRLPPTLLLTLLPTLLLTAGPAAAHGPDEPEASGQPRVSSDVVRVAAVPPRLETKARGEVRFVVRLDIADRWHLYDHGYAEDPESFYIGIDLMPAEGADLADYQVAYPPGKPGEFMGEKVSLLYGRVEITVALRLPDSAAGEVEVPLVLIAQACDDKLCLQPSEIPLTVKVAVQPE